VKVNLEKALTDINKRRKMEYDYKVALVRKKRSMKNHRMNNFQVSLISFIILFSIEIRKSLISCNKNIIS